MSNQKNSLKKISLIDCSKQRLMKDLDSKYSYSKKNFNQISYI